MDLTKKVLAKISYNLEDYYADNRTLKALRRQVAKHVPEMHTTGGVTYSGNEYYSEQCDVCRTDYPCDFITEVATDLGIEKEI
jgi:hypothetical protein